MTEILTLTCPSCGARVKPKDDSGRFLCEYCGNESLIRITAEAVARDDQPIKPRVAIPPNVRIEKDGKSAVIYQRWFSFQYIPMAFFCLAWDSFLFFWYHMALSGGAPLIAILFPVAHLAVGIYLTYATIAGFINRTVLEVTGDELAVWHEPLPWPGEMTIKTANLKQLYCKEKVSRRKRGYSYRYQLFAVTNDDRQVKLVSGLEEPDLAVFFEQQIEDWLKIKDQRVVGEFRG